MSQKAKGLKGLHTIVISTSMCLTGSKNFLVLGVGPFVASSSIAPGSAKSGTFFTTKLYTHVCTTSAILFYACRLIMCCMGGPCHSAFKISFPCFF